MKKNYYSPSVEVQSMNATYSLCAVSTTEVFGVSIPDEDLGADVGR